MRAKYPYRPIGSIDALSKVLACSKEQLIVTSQNSDLYYIKNTPIIKTNGEERITYNPREPLRSIQKKIVRNILRKVEYPKYLQGGIRDINTPRSYDRNAKLHSGSSILIHYDIQNFYDSIKAKYIKGIYQYFLKFHPEVANILLALSTHKNMLPQGAPPSSYLSNLVFWDVEPSLVNELSKMGIKYSRYIDDITLSSISKLTPSAIRKVKRMIERFISSKELRINSRKSKIQRKGEVMSVCNLNINSGRPTLPSKEKSKIRTAIKQLEDWPKSERQSMKFNQIYTSLEGRIRMLARFNPSLANKYKDRIGVIRLEEE